MATTADREALLHTLIAQAVRSRVAVGTLRARLQLAEQNLQSLRETLEVTESRYRAGVGDAVQLRLARENAASAEAQIPPLRAQLAVQEHALCVLLGRRPADLATLGSRDQATLLEVLAPYFSRNGSLLQLSNQHGPALQMES